MTDNIAELVKKLRAALTEQLAARGELLPGEDISIKVVVLTKKRKARTTLTIDFGLDAFTLGGNTFHERELTAEELQTIRQISFADDWQKAVVSHLLQGDNKPVSENQIRDTALEKGYQRKKSRGGRIPEVYGSTIGSRINNHLSDGNHNFRLIQVDRRKDQNSERTAYFRFYRIITPDPETEP